MPTTAPTRAPIAAEPAPQPTSAPTPIPAVVVPMRSAPAPAGSKDEGRDGSMRPEHNRPCNSRKPHGLAEIRASLYARSHACRDSRFRPATRPLHGSGGNSGWPEPTSSGRSLHARHAYPHRLSTEPAASRGSTSRSRPRSSLEILEPGDHLVAHSYGGVVSLLAAASADLRSLTVLEPPAFGVARGHPAVDRLVAELAPLWPTDLPPEEFLRRFVETIGALGPYNAPSPLPPEMEAVGTRDDGRESALGSRDPVRRPGRCAVPEARRLGCASTPPSTRSATCSRSGSARSGPCSPAPATRSHARPVSTTYSKTSSAEASTPNRLSNRLLLSPKRALVPL